MTPDPQRAACAVLLICLLFALPPAKSQTSSPVQTLEPVVVTGEHSDYAPAPNSATATKTDTPLLLTPQSVQTVPRAVLSDQKALTLSDAIRNVAGTGSDFGFNGGSQPLMMLRGFQMISMTAMGSMSGSSSYYLNGSKVQGVPVNMSNVESVEVVKGPAAVLYGRAEPGGLVNVVTRALSPVPAFGFEQTVGQYGLSRTLLEGSGALNTERTLLGRAAVSYYRTDSQRDYVHDQLGAATGTIGWVPDAKTRVTLTLDHNEQKYRTDYGVPAIGDRPADLPRNRQFNDAPELSSAKTNSAVLDAKLALSEAWTLKLRALTLTSKTREVDVAPYRFDIGGGFTPCQTGPDLQLCRYYYYARPNGSYRLDQFSADLIGKFELAGLDHQVLVGLESYRSRKDGTTYLQQLSSVSVADPALGNTPALDVNGPLLDQRETDDRTRWTSVLVQDQVAIGGGVHLVGALRYDRTSAIYDVPGTEPNKESFTSPRVGAVWAFTEGQSLYAQYQEAVSANNGRNPADGAALAAERSKQFELGYKFAALDGRLTSTIAAYQLVKRDRADFSLFPVVNTLGEARSRGLEWDLIGQATRQLAVMASYAYIDAVVTRDPNFAGTRLANVARQSGSLWGRYMIDAAWAVGGGVFAQGQRQGDQANSFQLPGYARVDLMASYAFKAGAAKGSVQLNLNNAFDTRYFTGSHQFVQDWIAPGAPRTVSATLRLDL
jgi:iron complex outermembrane recepter protein